MRLSSLLVFAATLAIGGCRCLDPETLQGFACESDGGCVKGYQCCADSVCRADCTPRDGGGGGGGDGGAGCSAANCPGCCEGDSCRLGSETDNCGTAGAACAKCEATTQQCQANVCVTLAANSASCSADSDCASAHCVESVCCNSECGQSCATCAASATRGQCTSVAAGTADAGCSPFVCDGLGLECPTQCSTIQQCAAGR